MELLLKKLLLSLVNPKMFWNLEFCGVFLSNIDADAAY